MGGLWPGLLHAGLMVLVTRTLNLGRMFDYLVRAAGLGVAGIDPFGAMLLFSVIAVGVRRARIVVFVASIFASTVLTGVVLAVAGSSIVRGLASGSLAVPSQIWAYLELALAAVIAVWIVRSMRERDSDRKRARKQRTLGRSAGGLMLAGVGFGMSAVMDPTFLATAALVGQSDSLGIVVASFAVWTLISQFMLFALLVAYLVGAEKPVVAFAHDQWDRHRALLMGILYATGIVVVIALVVDAVYFLASDRYLWG
jgi:hypothetical protein